MYRIIILLLFTLFITAPAYAAFPITSHKAIEVSAGQTYQYSVSQHPAPATPHPFGYSKGKSHVAAILLSLFGGFLGAHRFYLGYYWHGGIQLLLTTIGVLAIASTMTTPLWILGFMVAVLIFLPLSIWLLVDFIRICTEDLLPKNGDYN